MSGTVLTNKGLALITKLVAASTELQISRVAVGTGRVPSGVDPQTMVDLNEYKMDAQIESYGVSPDQSDVAYIAAQVSSIGVSAGFAVTEAGVFATDPDVGEILYAYLDLTEDPQYIYAETDAISKFAEITFNVLIGSVTKVTAYVSPGALTKKVDFNAFKESVETPEFDDSGTVSGISSFPDFLNLVKSKMNFFQFFRNFKAGMQFVLHAGQIVNNCVTDNSGLPLSAAQGKVLKDLYTQLYSEMGTILQYSHTSDTPFDFNDKNAKARFHRLGTENSFKNAPSGVNPIYSNVLVVRNNAWDTLSMTIYLYTKGTNSSVVYKTGNTTDWANLSWSVYATKSDLYPSYNRSILLSNLKADVTDQSITITEDGMVQAVARTQAIVGTAFVRFVVNNTVVYEGHTVSGTYRYLWTPIFPVKKGDVIKVTLETTTADGQRFVYFYKS